MKNALFLAVLLAPPVSAQPELLTAGQAAAIFQGAESRAPRAAELEGEGWYRSRLAGQGRFDHQEKLTFLTSEETGRFVVRMESGPVARGVPPPAYDVLLRADHAGFEYSYGTGTKEWACRFQESGPRLICRMTHKAEGFNHNSYEIYERLSR